MKTLNILCLPYTSIEGKVTENVDGVLEIIIEELHRDRTDLVVLPELFTCGYCAKNLSIYAESVDGSTMQKFRKYSKELDVWIGYGFAESYDTEYVYNSWALVGPRGQMHVYRKTHLHPASAGVPNNERDFLVKGSSLEPFKTDLGSIGIMICYDGCFVEVPRTLVLKGADLLLWPTRSGGYIASQSLPHVRALDNTVPVVQVEGGQKGKYKPMTQYSITASATGMILTSKKNDDNPFRVQVNLDEGRILRASSDTGGHSLYQTRRPDLYCK